MATVSQSGSQTASIDTEHTLTTTINTAGTYVLKVDCNAMALGDIVELRVKVKCRAADTARLAYLATYSHVQTEPIKHSLPIPIATNEALDITLTQTDGTGRAFPWNVLAL